MKNKIKDKLKQNKYFRSLEKKRFEWQTKLDKAKFNFVVDKIIGNKQNFVRNYSVFSTDKYSALNNFSNATKQKVEISNDGIRSNIVTKLEKDNPMKYRRKIFERDSFASIYQKNPLVPSLIYIHNSNRNQQREIQNNSNEKSMIAHQIIQNDNCLNKSNKDQLPSIDENTTRQLSKYINLSISKTNLKRFKRKTKVSLIEFNCFDERIQYK